MLTSARRKTFGISSCVWTSRPESWPTAGSFCAAAGKKERRRPTPVARYRSWTISNWEKITGDKVKDWQLSGSLYASLPPGVAALRPIGDWNTYQITYKGSRMKVELNGRTLYDIDTFEVPVVYPDKPKFKDRVPTGFIGLQRHAPSQVEGDAYAWFRNIFIRELDND